MTKEKGSRNPPEVMSRIAARLVELRYNHGKFGEATGMSRQWGYALMRNEIAISGAQLARIAEILGVTMDSLWFGEDGKKRENFEDYVKKICDERIAEKLSQ